MSSRQEIDGSKNNVAKEIKNRFVIRVTSRPIEPTGFAKSLETSVTLSEVSSLTNGA